MAEVNIQYDDVFESLEEFLFFAEESTFYIYRTYTNSVLARGVQSFDKPKKQESKTSKVI